MPKRRVSIAAEEEIKRDTMYREVGAFVFQFSQLEFTIRAKLSNALKLKKEQFEAVVGPYDFAVLCNVTKIILSQKYPEKKGKVEEVFEKCRGLNTDRVRIVHGLWTVDHLGSRAWHIGRNNLKGQQFFADADALQRLTANAKRYMIELISLNRNNIGPTRIIGVEIMDAKPKRRQAPVKEPDETG